MKRFLSLLIVLSIPLFACSIASTSTPQVPTDSPLNPVETVPPMATVPPVVPSVVPNVTCNNLSFYLDPAIASGYSCKTVQENAEGIEIYPQFTDLTLQGYPISQKFFIPHISVFPVQRYIELLPEYFATDLPALQALIAGGAPGKTLPFLPRFNAAQLFHALYLALPFRSGSGIRYATEFAQYSAPVNNTDLFYTFQGLTSDGKYWVSAILPINNPILPPDANNPPAGMTWDQLGNNYDAYITDMITQLSSQAPDSYIPTLAALDALVSTITITP